MGSFTGAVPCKRITQGHKGWLSMDGNHAECVKAEASLIARPAGQASTKVCLSDPPSLRGKGGA